MENLPPALLTLRRRLDETSILRLTLMPLTPGSGPAFLRALGADDAPRPQ